MPSYLPEGLFENGLISSAARRETVLGRMNLQYVVGGNAFEMLFEYLAFLENRIADLEEKLEEQETAT